MSSKNLDNDILDQLIEKIAYNSLQLTAEVCGPEESQARQIEYICRAFSEILGVLICAAPSNEVQKVCSNITNWLTGVVSYNLQMSQALGMPLPNEGQSLDDIFKDSFLSIKKGEA